MAYLAQLEVRGTVSR